MSIYFPLLPAYGNRGRQFPKRFHPIVFLSFATFLDTRSTIKDHGHGVLLGVNRGEGDEGC